MCEIGCSNKHTSLFRNSVNYMCKFYSTCPTMADSDEHPSLQCCDIIYNRKECFIVKAVWLKECNFCLES
jgi:hypothetical protein